MKSLFLSITLVASMIIVGPVLALDRLALEQYGFNPYEAGSAYNPDQPHPGGFNGGTDDITWTILPLAPVTVCRAAIGRIGNYIYIFGGQGTGGGSTALAFNITTEEWENSSPASLTGSNWVGAVVGDSCMYVFPPTFRTEVQKFTPTGGGPTGAWAQVGTFPQPTSAMAVAWDGGNYIYTGGTAGSPYSGNSYRFDLTTHTFTQIATLPDVRAWAGGEFVNGRFYVLGGSNSSYQYTNSCYEYDPGTNTWTAKAPMIKALSFNCFNSATDGSLIYLVGGGAGNAASIPATDTVQVYDPVADNWFIDNPRWSATTGTNAACYVAVENYLFDCGGRDLVTTYQNTMKGSLPGGPAFFRVTLTPWRPPIQVNPGGFFWYLGELDNTTANPVTFDLWAEAILPNGVHYGPLLLYHNLTLGSMGHLERAVRVNVPHFAPPGNYQYYAAVGDYPGTVIDDDQFPFTIIVGDPVSSNNQWLVEPFEGGLAPIPTEYSLGSASPNPFNPATNMTFIITETGWVSLKVYDALGREIALLAEGFYPAGSHEVVFDGAALASGVYFAVLKTNGSQYSRKMLLLK